MNFVIDRKFIADTLRLEIESTNSKIAIKEYRINGRVTESENNLFTEIIKIDVAYTKDGELAKKSLIVKCPFNTFLYSSLAPNGVFDKEVCMYETILPEMNRLLDLQISPHLYLVTCKQVLVLQDLSNFGYSTENYRKQLSFEQSKIALETVARFHAASYKLFLKKRNALDAVSKDVLFTPEFTQRIVKTWFPIISAVLEKEKFFPHQIQKLASVQDELIEKMPSSLESENFQFNVLNHGDFRTTNILLKHNDVGEPVETKLIDFQLCRWCSPVFDIIFFVMTSLPFDTFEKYSDELFDSYLRTLNNTLSKLGCKYEYGKLDLKKDLTQLKLFYLSTFFSLGVLIGDSNCLNFNLSCMKADEGSDPISEANIAEKIYKDEILRSAYVKWFKYFLSAGIV